MGEVTEGKIKTWLEKKEESTLLSLSLVHAAHSSLFKRLKQDPFKVAYTIRPGIHFRIESVYFLDILGIQYSSLT